MILALIAFLELRMHQLSDLVRFVGQIVSLGLLVSVGSNSDS